MSKKEVTTHTPISDLQRRASADYIWESSPYTRRLVPDEDGGYSATVQEFPGCIADGDSAEEALENLRKVAISWIQSHVELGQNVPDPIAFGRYSGKVALRIPRGLHKRAAELSALEGVSLNQLLTTAISFYVGQRKLLEDVRSELRKSANDTHMMHFHSTHMTTNSFARQSGKNLYGIKFNDAQLTPLKSLPRFSDVEYSEIE